MSAASTSPTGALAFGALDGIAAYARRAGWALSTLASAAPGWALALVAALVGGSLGSFAALVAARLPDERSLWWPRSHCEACGAPIAARHLVPVLSYLWLGGRCRACRAPIGARALTSELVMGAVAVALAARLDLGWPWVGWLWVLTLTWAAALIDLDSWWVPDVLLGAALPAAVLLGLGAGGLGRLAAGLLPALGLAAVGWAGSRLRGEEALGLGDVKLVGLMGLGLGLGRGLAAVTLAALQGAAVGGLLRLGPGHPVRAAGPLPRALVEDADWRPPPHAVPFAPFVWLGAAEVLLFPALAGLWPF